MALSQPRPRPAPLSEGLAPGSYLTDGERLFCVVSDFERGPDGEAASLEDCMTLEVRPYPAGELAVMALRRISPAAAPARKRSEDKDKHGGRVRGRAAVLDDGSPCAHEPAGETAAGHAGDD